MIYIPPQGPNLFSNNNENELAMAERDKKRKREQLKKDREDQRAAKMARLEGLFG